MLTAKTTLAETILAIDLGKYKSVACLSRNTATRGHTNSGRITQRSATAADRTPPVAWQASPRRMPGGRH
jgi:hypothetical protein